MAGRVWADLNEEQRERNRADARERARRLRLEALQRYGGVCACCGESEPAFLHIDHVDGGGNRHRREVLGDNRGGNFTKWLRRNGWPDGFRVLCANCNMAIAVLGTCPHQTE